MPAGTPRGFNLSSFGVAGMPPLPGFGPSGFPAFFAGHAVQAPVGWSSTSDDRGPGPIRRGGGRFNSTQRPGPYDRRQPREPRWGDSGRLSPPSGTRSSNTPRPSNNAGGGKWGDGASGGAAVGPREAVQGRSLKSYEDLDAVGGAGNGELNY